MAAGALAGAAPLALAYALLPTGATVVGGVVASFRPPGARLLSALQHFAAGVVFSVAAVELLPDVVREHTPVEVVVGFGLGVAAMLVIRRLTGNLEEAKEEVEQATEHAEHRRGSGRRVLAAQTGLLVATGVDLLLDGLLLGIAFVAGEKEGRLLTLALATELLSLGLATSATLSTRGTGRPLAIGATAVLALLFASGAVAGATVLRGLGGGDLAGVLSFGLAALLYLVTEELLAEAHEQPDTAFIVATFFAGFLLFLVLGMVT